MDEVAVIRQLVGDELAKDSMPLPIPDEIAGNLQSLLGKESIEYNDLALIIEKDSSLTAKVLNLANSPFYSGLVRIKSIEQAVTRIGLQAIKSLLMTILFKDVFKIKKKYLAEDFRLNWQHSLACAICTKKIIEQSNVPFIAEDGYILGLLHDIGFVTILNALSTLQEKQQHEIQHDGIVSALYQLHSDVGAEVLRKLQFNENICRIVETHHEPQTYEQQENTLFNVLQVSDALLKKIGLSLAPNPDLVIAELPYAARLQLDDTFLSLLESEIESLSADTDNLL